MGKFFDMEGPVMSGLTRIADLMIVNLLFVVCSLPIFTMGASLTALYYITLKMVKNEECYIVKGFFKSFKQNFRQATIIWLIALFAGFVLISDFSIVAGKYSSYVNMPDGISKVLLVLLFTAGLFYILTVSFVFPQLAKFDNTIKNTIKNSLFMAVSHVPSAIAVVVTTVFPIVVMIMAPQLLICFFIIFALIAYCNSFLFVRIYKRYIPEDEITGDSDFSVNIENTGSTDEN